MIWTITPWIFYVICAIVTLVIGGAVAYALHRAGANRSKRIERMLSPLLAVFMVGLFFYLSFSFADRLQPGEQLITADSLEQAQETKAIIPLGSYAVLDNVYAFGYYKNDQWNGSDVLVRVRVTGEEAFLESYDQYIAGNGIFFNHSRVRFEEAYEQEWQASAKEAESRLLDGGTLKLDGVTISAEQTQ
ncbi:hypothetical protein CHL76_10200 [Marinococcus halophilus]|uniref:Uncharacterized protein n=1 Tax=Marinococcus halophilus TaxID=1371 RepID=A0A510Y4A5_MARHA|nr:hypothetical protein [Marinococcus halophilus]OZT80063.1 hypothetical protein CHL76_10200 [Marinococcus halophilus]GEK58013.1 hypothetical protein MHA01_09180 [Marinococcus halophilus]